MCFCNPKQVTFAALCQQFFNNPYKNLNHFDRMIGFTKTPNKGVFLFLQIMHILAMFLCFDTYCNSLQKCTYYKLWIPTRFKQLKILLYIPVFLDRDGMHGIKDIFVYNIFILA
jgi:hypothetical protein